MDGITPIRGSVSSEEVANALANAYGGWLMPLLLVCAGLLLSGIVVGLLLSDIAEKPEDEPEPVEAEKPLTAKEMRGWLSKVEKKLEPVSATPASPKPASEPEGSTSA